MAMGVSLSRAAAMRARNDGPNDDGLDDVSRWSDRCDRRPDVILEIAPLREWDLLGGSSGEDVADDEIDVDRLFVAQLPAFNPEVAEVAHRRLADAERFLCEVEISERAEPCFQH